jgi:hypothetical protein
MFSWAAPGLKIQEKKPQEEEENRRHLYLVAPCYRIYISGVFVHFLEKLQFY